MRMDASQILPAKVAREVPSSVPRYRLHHVASKCGRRWREEGGRDEGEEGEEGQWEKESSRQRERNTQTHIHKQEQT